MWSAMGVTSLSEKLGNFKFFFHLGPVAAFHIWNKRIISNEEQMLQKRVSLPTISKYIFFCLPEIWRNKTAS